MCETAWRNLVWIDSQTEEEIQRGIREAKPMSAYENLGKSGIMRTIEDYAMGINFSRVMSVKYGGLLNNAAGTRSYTAIAVGRVMTCVLGMVVIREREIRNFKETPFYRVVGNFTDAHVQGEWKAVEGSGYFASPLLYKENGFREKKDALALIDRVQGHSAIVESIEKIFPENGRRYCLIWQSCRQNVQNDSRSARMKPYRWRRICMNGN